jgi:hypothetical protein
MQGMWNISSQEVKPARSSNLRRNGRNQFFTLPTFLILNEINVDTMRSAISVVCLCEPPPPPAVNFNA